MEPARVLLRTSARAGRQPARPVSFSGAGSSDRSGPSARVPRPRRVRDARRPARRQHPRRCLGPPSSLPAPRPPPGAPAEGLCSRARGPWHLDLVGVPVPVTVAGFRLVVAALYEVLVAEALPVQAALKADPATGARRAQRGRLRDVRRAAVVDAVVESPGSASAPGAPCAPPCSDRAGTACRHRQPIPPDCSPRDQPPARPHRPAPHPPDEPATARDARHQRPTRDHSTPMALTVLQARVQAQTDEDNKIKKRC